MLRLVGVVGVLFVLPACSPGCFLKPDEHFDASKVAAAPDYKQASHWAAMPGKKSKVALTPKGVLAEPKPAADVFYLHPTAWFSRKVWNDTLKAKNSKELIDHVLMSSQASAFNGCCRIYAPRYRQATISAFYGSHRDAQRAFAVAYEDVLRAFEVFIKDHNQGRPFIIAGHSQGSMHAMRLLTHIDKTPALRERMIAAYIPGFGHPMSHFGKLYKTLKPCTEPAQTMCVASWDTYKEGASVGGLKPLVYWSDDRVKAVPEKAPRQCTNPISWRADDKASNKKAHKGAVEMKNVGNPVSFTKILFSEKPIGFNVTGLKAPRKAMLSARCVKGVLRVPDVDDLNYPEQETESGNYHLLDYELFYMDIRHNAQARTQAWLKAHPPSAPKTPAEVPETQPAATD